ATGSLVAIGEALELCAPGQTSQCPGIEILGSIDSVFVSEPGSVGDVPVVRIEGHYDGRRLHLTGSLELVDSFHDQDFTTPCEELQATGGQGNPDLGLVNQVVSYTQAHPDTFATWWWDGASGVANVWFTGEASAHRSELERLLDPVSVCVLGGADYTEAHLSQVRDAFYEDLNKGEIPLKVGFGSSGGLSNRVEVGVNAVDQPTLDLLRERYGEGLVVFAFMELLEAPLADLPPYIPVGPDELDLVTSEVRFGGGMNALGHFEVQFDSTLGCFYLNDQTERVLPVWQFGYSAGIDPVAVYDEDGNLVAVPGDSIKAGGGGWDLDRLDEPNTCGATRVWIFNGDPIVTSAP
ncbi:MAG: hypothetical protein ACR2NL_06215, partial [Acidimicrobiia bacterium]